MGFLGKFSNAVGNGIQGITSKVGGAWNAMKDTASNAWDKTKGVTGKVWEGVKDAASKTGQFIYDNSDAIAGVVGGAALGAANYFGGPGAESFLKGTLSSAANFIPDGKVKDALLSAAGERQRNKSKPPNVDLTEENPGGVHYASNVGGNAQSSGGTGSQSNGNAQTVSDAAGTYIKKHSNPVPNGYDPMFVHNTPNALTQPFPVYHGKYVHKNSSKDNRKKIKPPKKNKSRSSSVSKHSKK